MDHRPQPAGRPLPSESDCRPNPYRRAPRGPGLEGDSGRRRAEPANPGESRDAERRRPARAAPDLERRQLLGRRREAELQLPGRGRRGRLQGCQHFLGDDGSRGRRFGAGIECRSRGQRDEPGAKARASQLFHRHDHCAGRNRRRRESDCGTVRLLLRRGGRSSAFQGRCLECARGFRVRRTASRRPERPVRRSAAGQCLLRLRQCLERGRRHDCRGPAAGADGTWRTLAPACVQPPGHRDRPPLRVALVHLERAGARLFPIRRPSALLGAGASHPGGCLPRRAHRGAGTLRLRPLGGRHSGRTGAELPHQGECQECGSAHQPALAQGPPAGKRRLRRRHALVWRVRQLRRRQLRRHHGTRRVAGGEGGLRLASVDGA